MDPVSLFERIDHETIADAVVEQIESMIIAGILKEGRKLPSERELSERMGVSRPKLREALQILEDRGLLVVRHGEGTFVARLTGRAMSPALLALYTRHGEAFHDYLEYRTEQEVFASRLAAERATLADKERITEIIEDMKAYRAKDDGEAERQADIRFHAAVVDASHNVTLIHMMASIYDLAQQGMFYNRNLLRSIDGSGKALLDQHVAIATAIIDGDPGRAEQAARAHMDFVEQSVRQGREQQFRELSARKRKLFASS